MYTHNGWILLTLDEYFALNPVKTERKEKRRRDCARVNEQREGERERARAIFRSIKIIFLCVVLCGICGSSGACVKEIFRGFFFPKNFTFLLRIQKNTYCEIVFLLWEFGGAGRVVVKKRRWIGAMWRRRSLWMLSRKWSGPRRQGHCRNSFRSLPLRRLNPNGTLALNATFTSKSPSLLSIPSSSSSSSCVCVCARLCSASYSLEDLTPVARCVNSMNVFLLWFQILLWSFCSGFSHDQTSSGLPKIQRENAEIMKG